MINCSIKFKYCGYRGAKNKKLGKSLGQIFFMQFISKIESFDIYKEKKSLFYYN